MLRIYQKEVYLKYLDREEVRSHINKSFIKGVQEFKGMLLSKLSPKRSFQDGEYVTGEGKLNGFMKGKFMMIYVLIQSFDISISFSRYNYSTCFSG